MNKDIAGWGDMTYLEKIKSKIKDPVYVPVLNEDMVWQEHGTLIWKAEKFEGEPFFNNVYRYNDYYSFSLLALILLKDSLKINQVALDKIAAPMFSNNGGNQTIDAEIVKMGAPHPCRFDHNDVDEYVKLIVDALIKDIKHIEDKNPGKTNIVMCGGRDSLNLLLLPWKNPVMALSADPNYPLVKQFIIDNNLDIPVRKLEDPSDDDRLKNEVLEACCRANLMHWRWSVDLCNIAEEFDHNAILWKGQLGDVYLTHDWKTFITPYKEPQRFFRRAYKKFSYLLPQFFHTWVGHHFQKIVVDRVWEVCCSLQGGHMSFLRGLLDMLVLSAYHGPNVREVISKADLGIVAQRDIRPKIGNLLLGREVKYPSENPYPKVSEFREGLHEPERLANMLQEAGIDVIWPSDVKK